MGNRVRTDITIGGRLNACCVPDLLEELEDYGLSIRGLGPAGEDLPLPEDAAGLERLLALGAEADRKEGVAPRGFPFGDDEVNYGNLDGVRGFCQQRGLPYHYDCADGNGEFDAEDEWWSPAHGFTTLYSLVNSGGAVPLAALRESFKGVTGADIAAWYDARTVGPGPLEVVELPAGGVCRGCLADALLPGAAHPEDFAGPALESPEAAG
jgi:hypothetical protein